MITKAQLQAALKNPKKVMFFKANGDTRGMIAKINPDTPPAQFGNSDAVSVIDCKTGNYRAIKASSVLSLQGEMV